MSRTYTQLLWLLNLLPAGVTLGPTPPAGQLWVVRDVVFDNQSSQAWSQLSGIRLREVSTDVLLAGVGPAEAYAGKVYSYELRQALNAGDQIEVVTEDENWSLRVTGYIFDV